MTKVELSGADGTIGRFRWPASIEGRLSSAPPARGGCARHLVIRGVSANTRSYWQPACAEQPGYWTLQNARRDARSPEPAGTAAFDQRLT
jgi:hypothetical protein